MPFVNPLERMRMKRVMLDDPEAAPAPQANAGGDWEKLFSQVGPEQQKYQDNLANMPDQSQFAPSFLKRLGVSLIGGAKTFAGGDGGKFIDDILQKPYKHAMGQWGMKNEALAKSSNLEENTFKNRLSGKKLDADTSEKKADNERQASQFSMEFGRKSEADKARDANADSAREETGRHNRTMEGLGGRNAATAEKNAGVAAERGKKYGEFVDKYGKKGNGAPPPSRVTSAERQAVLDTIKANPEYQEFADSGNLPLAVNKENTGWFGSKSPNPKRDDYDKFLKEVERRKKVLLGGVSPYGDMFDLEEDK